MSPQKYEGRSRSQGQQQLSRAREVIPTTIITTTTPPIAFVPPEEEEEEEAWEVLRASRVCFLRLRSLVRN